MPKHDLEIRVEFLEKTVAGLGGLPQQVRDLSVQFLQLRADVTGDISTLRADVGDLRVELLGVRDGLRGEMHGLRGELRTEMHGIREDLRTEMHGIREDLTGKIDGCREELRSDMASMHRELAKAILATQAQARSLHEDLVERIARLAEGRAATGTIGE